MMLPANEGYFVAAYVAAAVVYVGYALSIGARVRRWRRRLAPESSRSRGSP